MTKTWKLEYKLREKMTQDKFNAEIDIMVGIFNAKMKTMRDAFKCEITDINNTHYVEIKFT